MAEPQPASASQSALARLEGQLTCPVCLEHLQEPRALQCLHSFCLRCIEGLVVREEDIAKCSVTCPTCRKVTEVLEGRVSELQTPFYIQGLFEIQRDLEKASRRSESDVLSGPKVVAADESSPAQCSVHSRAIEFYCEECEELLCGGCVCGEHRRHTFNQVSSAVLKVVVKIEGKLERLEERVRWISEAVGEVEEECSRALGEGREVQAAIHERFRLLREALDEREKELIEEQEKLTREKLKSLAAQRDQFELVGTQLRSCRDFVQESLRTGSEAEILAMKKKLMEKIDDMYTSSEIDTEITQTCDVAFFSDDIILQNLSTLAVYQKTPCAEHCHAAGSGVTVAKVGKEAEVEVSLHDQHRSEMRASSAVVSAVSAELQTCVGSDVVRCQVELAGGNKCRVKYQPVVKGPHSLTIDVTGQPVRGSPFQVSIKSPLSDIGGSPGRVIPGLHQPWGVAMDPEGRVCVAESGSREVALFDRSRERARTIVKRGILRHPLHEPSGVAFDQHSNLIVADIRLCCVLRFTLDGRMVKSVGCVGRKPLEFTHPSAVGCNPVNNRVYIAEWGDNNRVQILNSDLSYHKSFGHSGSGSGEFLCPSGLAFDGEGNVYVADSNNARIQVFTAEGDYLREFGRRGRREGRLGLPVGICMDRSSSVLYIADCLNHRIDLFTTAGEYLRSFGSCSSDPCQLNHPQGIAVDEYRFVYVSDTHNNRVVVF